MLHTCFPAGYLHPVATVRGVALCLSYPPPPPIDFFYRIAQLLCRFVLCGFHLSFGLGEPHATIHRALADLLADAIVGRVSHGTAHLPSSQRYYLTAKGIGEAARVLGFETPSDFVRAYHVSREWLALLIRRMDVVAAVYRLAASLSPGVDGLRSHVEFHRRGRFDSTITLHDGRSFGVVRHRAQALPCGAGRSTTG